MKAKKLIAILKKHPEREVVLAKDAEGNGFGPLADVEEGNYVPQTTWSGDVYGIDDEHPPAARGLKASEAFVLWPTN